VAGPAEHKWRCNECGKLLGIIRGARLHIRIARAPEYLVTLPATAACDKCHSLNEFSLPKEETCNGSMITR